MKRIVFLLFVIIIVIAFNTKDKSLLIPSSAIRIRVIANSDSVNDQKLKSEIKNSISEYIYKELYNVRDINEAEKKIASKMESIKNIVKKYTNDFSVTYGNNEFPEKEYKGIKYKKGMYKSLVIKLGKGQGKNFWCVLFPPLCMIDENQNSDYKYKFYIEELLKKYK